MSDPEETLRRQAEARVQSDPELKAAFDAKSADELIHELLVHQVELEIQNEELRTAQRELLKSRDRFAELYDFAPIGYLTVNPDGVILDANLTLARMLQMERRYLTRKPLTLFMDPHSHETFFRHRQAVLDGDGGIRSCELNMKAKSGDRFDAKLISFAVTEMDADETEPSLLRCALTDVTEEKRTEAALRQTHQALQRKAGELENLNAELSQYAFVVSHDLKAPLRAIQNYVRFLNEDLGENLTGDPRRYLDGLKSAVEEANALIGDLLELSRIDRRTDVWERVNIGVSIRDTLNTIKLPAAVEVEMTDDWPEIEANPVLLRQVLQNLITNAVKFNHAEVPRIELGWRSVPPDAYELHIRDNGIGIDPAYHEQIFGVFDRLHTKDEYEGTGIGLSIVRKALSKLRGSVRLDSAVGKGSTFYITLPRRRPAAMTPSSPGGPDREESR